MTLDVVILFKLILAAILGGLVGWERERQNQPAGLRTHIILTLGATLAMIVSIDMSIQLRPFVLNGDPARLAAQVISGIGFLGAGAILRYGTNIKGLTTATSLWTTAIVGLAVGADMYMAAAGTTLLILVVLTLVNEIEKRYIRSYDTRALTLEAEDRAEIVNEFRQLMKNLKLEIISFGITRDVERKIITFDVVVKGFAEKLLDPVINQLGSFPGVNHYKIQ